MTCHELRLYYEDAVRVDAGRRVDPAEVAAHIADCADCGRFVEAQRDVGIGLRLVRECIHDPSASLDAAVLANYRRHVAEKPSPADWIPAAKRRSFALLRWSVALGAVVLVAVIPFPRSRKNVATIAYPQAAPPVAVSQATHPHSNLSAVTKRELPPAAAHPVRRRHPASSVATLGDPLPVGFRSLMYCDELSCSGPMEMIRVQLPSSAAFPSPSTLRNEVVFADVLVGSDGIARGIRIVQ